MSNRELTKIEGFCALALIFAIGAFARGKLLGFSPGTIVASITSSVLGLAFLALLLPPLRKNKLEIEQAARALSLIALAIVILSAIVYAGPDSVWVLPMIVVPLCFALTTFVLLGEANTRPHSSHSWIRFLQVKLLQYFVLLRIVVLCSFWAGLLIAFMTLK